MRKITIFDKVFDFVYMQISDNHRSPQLKYTTFRTLFSVTVKTGPSDSKKPVIS